MESKIEQIDLGSTEWELSDALRKYKPEVMAKVLDKMVEIIDHLNSQDQEEEKLILTEYQVGLLSKIRSGDYLYEEHIRKEGLTTVLVELLRNDTTLLYNIIRDNIGDERIVDAINSQVNIQDTPEQYRSKEDMERTDYTDYPYSKKFQYTTKDTSEEINPYEKITKEYAGAFAKDEEKGDIKRLREEVKDTPEETESEVQEWEKKWEEFFLYVTNDKNWVDGRPEWKGNVYITLYNAMKDFIKNLLLERERWAIDTFLKDTASYNSFHNGRPRTMRNGLSGEGFEVRVSKLTTK